MHTWWYHTWWYWVIVLVIFIVLIVVSLFFQTDHKYPSSGSPDFPSWRYERTPSPSRLYWQKKKKKKKKTELTLDSMVSRAVKNTIKTGLLIHNVPTEMIQGKNELIEVGIARSADLRETLAEGLRGRRFLRWFERIETAYYMEVKLSGKTFEITSNSLPEQLIVPSPAHWEFDVLPCRAGLQTITLSVNMRVEAEGIIGGRRGSSVLNKRIDVRVNRAFAARRFFTNNWQWLIAAVLALAGAIAAWLVVPF